MKNEASLHAQGASPAQPLAAGEAAELGKAFKRLREETGRRIVGQSAVVDELLTAILAEGHCLITGVPGLAKTLMVSTLAELIALRFKRLQFTPDLMPSDITGATIISEDSETHQRGYHFLKGPIFSHMILADEINRTPPKTQAALMEAMEERQVTAGGRRLPLERPFFVLATQNPIEQEGTYSLPVSQTDRFLFNVLIDYPRAEEEFEILQRTTSAYQVRLEPVLERETVLWGIEASRRVEIPGTLVEAVTRLVRMTRPTDVLAPDFVRELVSWGAGPRAVQSLIVGAKAQALLAGRSRVEPGDIRRIAAPALRHRLILSYHGEAEGMEQDSIIQRLLPRVPGGLLAPPEGFTPSGPGEERPDGAGGGKLLRPLRALGRRALGGKGREKHRPR